MTNRHKTGWDRIYHTYPPESLPWELGKPREVLVELVDSGKIKPCQTLDLCCGVGTNPIYLAEKGFDVIGLDLSDEAVKYARNKSQKTRTTIALLVSSFLNLPFKHKTIGFVFDFGCFHHVEVENRASFIRGVNNVLKTEGMYLMVCFSYKNGPAWNHFRKDQLEELFGEYFDIKWIKHISSVEGDKVTRYFYEILMENR